MKVRIKGDWATGTYYRALPYVALAVYMLVNVYPFMWMVSAAFKNNHEIFVNPGLIPSSPTLEPVLATWSKLHFFQYAGNSLIYAGLSLGGILVIYPLAAFAFAKLKFRGRELAFGLLLATLLVPYITILVPVVLLDQMLGLLNTWPGVVIPTISAAAPVSVFLLRNYFEALPHEMFEAARLDGATMFSIYWRIYLPLSVPALTTIAILSLVFIWNAYILPSVIITDPNMYTLPLGLFSLRTSSVPQWNQVMAGSLISVLPLVGAFVLLQRYYIAGLTVGSTK